MPGFCSPFGGSAGTHELGAAKCCRVFCSFTSVTGQWLTRGWLRTRQWLFWGGRLNRNSGQGACSGEACGTNFARPRCCRDRAQQRTIIAGASQAFHISAFRRSDVFVGVGAARYRAMEVVALNPTARVGKKSMKRARDITPEAGDGKVGTGI